MGFSQAIRGLFRREDEPALRLDAPAKPGPLPGPASTPRPSAAEKARFKRFEGRLETLRQDGDEGGRLQMIALSRIKERLGDDWPRLASRVHGVTEHILERRLTNEDVYVQVGDRYMVLFASLTSVEATFKAQAIAREVTALLVGELTEVDEVRIQVTVHEIDPAAFEGPSSMENLAATLDDVAARTPATDPDPESHPGPSPPDLAARGPVRFDYLPIWSRRGKAIVGYACTCRQHDAVEDEDPYDLDCLALRTVLATLPEMERNGHAALVVAPIRWDTLVQLQRRQNYLDLCRHAPTQLNRHLGFSISDVAAGAWRGLIRDRLFPLKPFARFLLFRAPPEPAQIRNLADIGIDALAIDPLQGGTYDHPQRRRIEGFVRNAARHKLATCALGVGEPRIVRSLLKAGTDFLAGDAIAPKVDAPGAAYRLDLNG